MIPDDEYPRLIRALRITGTLLILAHGWTAMMASLSISKYSPLFDKVLPGGTQSLPAFTQALIKSQYQVGGLLAALLLGGLFLIWSAPRLSRIVLTIGVVVSCLSFAALLIDRVMQYPVQNVISSFAEQ